MEEEKTELLQLDLVLCVDLTASMTPFIEAARRRMTEILTVLVEQEGLDLQVGVVGYRDYGEKIEVIETYPFNKNIPSIHKILSRLKVKSPVQNIDAAEAVLAGLLASVDQLAWRVRSTKIIILVGDAPPHGCGTGYGPYPDRYEVDPTGVSLLDTSARIESAGITLYALGMIPSLSSMYDNILEESFSRLASTTGGMYQNVGSAKATMMIIEEISAKVSRQIDFDRCVWETLCRLRDSASPLPIRTLVNENISELEQELGATAAQIHAAVSRLEKRGFCLGITNDVFNT